MPKVKTVQRELWQAYWKYIEGIVTPLEDDHNIYSSMKRFWTYIKHQKTDHSEVAPIKVDGKLSSELKQKRKNLKIFKDTIYVFTIVLEHIFETVINFHFLLSKVQQVRTG